MAESQREPLDGAARIAILAGVIVSNAITLYQGRHNAHLWVTIGFVAWVTAPYILFSWATEKSVHWAPEGRRALQWLTILFVLVSLAFYVLGAFGPPRPQPVKFLVMFPPIAWILTAGVMIAARRPPQSPA
jgi:hypothetical protein